MFDYKTAAENIKEINKIVETCPDSVKEKCFESLFSIVFGSSNVRQLKSEQANNASDSNPQSDHTTEVSVPLSDKKASYKLPSNILAFTRKYGLDVKDLEKLFILDHEPLLPVYKINSRNITQAQLQKVMMVLLENGLLNNQLKAPYIELRDSCKEDGLYDGNFNKMLKARFKLFKGAVRSDKIVDSEVVELTGEGYEKLAETIKELNGQPAKNNE